MAAAQSWEAAQISDPSGLPPEIAALLGSGGALQLAIPEHRVALPGAGADSQCDVFALVQAGEASVALTVEAKVDEAFGPTIGTWLAEDKDNKRERLAALCNWLGVSYPPPEPLRYQLFHRSAAAVAEARRFNRPVAAMVVQSFSPTHRWIEDFEAFALHLGVQAGLGRLGRTRLPDGIELWLGWAQGDARFLMDLDNDG
ncbi:hypothetical protein SAMN06265370_113119 [Puniceibacterium sediminis]|uniref:DUF6946 domain-containing protein n=2 Tax=Puniceibacterium sediminis TaxID=1608407 RepID=A0A238XZU3_9RHOB|nr:hypothetical protein SAMN06265370_113119 [Puniceibacterium sediminis]